MKGRVMGYKEKDNQIKIVYSTYCNNLKEILEYVETIFDMGAETITIKREIPRNLVETRYGSESKEGKT